MPTTVVYSPDYECDIGMHVFPTEKFRLVRDALLAKGRVASSEVVEPEMAPREDLLLVHDPAYLDDLDDLRWTPRTRMSELPLTHDIVRAYKLAAGGTTLAARQATAQGFGINLGGGFHHAYSDHAEGFCYLNDLAIAVRVLQRDHLVRRASVVDCDVHQGNGTAAIFRDDPSVFTFSIHQEMNYPVPKERSNLDIGLENGTGDAEYGERLARGLERVWDFAPELVLYQAGADPFLEDLLGGLALTRAGLEARDRRVLEGCAQRDIPVVVTLGGGYARDRDDTIAIHVRTCEMALTLGRRPPREARQA
jgi:acetoin utilization deacetylase AcuC-like enzyme